MEYLRQVKNIKSSNKETLKKVILPFLSAKKDTKTLHKVFSYPAKFQGRLPESLIKNLTKEGDLVLDAYSGGGTTSVEAMLAGRNSYAIDLNPISVVISKSKTIKLSKQDFESLYSALDSLKEYKRTYFLNSEEELLMGNSLSSFSSSVIRIIEKNKSKNWIYLLSAILIKRIKLSTRRDKTHLRTASFKKHKEYITTEIKKVQKEMQELSGKTVNSIDYGSNHEMPLKSESVELIVTSPPYPNVDIEYNLIQLQRRDLKRCYRSNIAQRLCESALDIKTRISKKDLCNGGFEEKTYWENAELSLQEMRRVLKKGRLCFVYIGFKNESDRNHYEEIAESCGFKVMNCFDVELGMERVASSRGLYHGKDTQMMKQDYLYILG